VRIPNLAAMGLGNLTPGFSGARNPRPEGAFGKMAERSAGKDTATGHWEMAGLITRTPFRTYPGGFPPEIVEPFEARIGRRVIGNKAASGTEILKELGEQHLRTGSPILYTSGDSVFQVAAHEDLIPPDELYRICRIGYEIACLGHGVCRVIARPFVGRTRDEFKRTPNRRDFPVPPHGETLLDLLAGSGLPVFGVGKIEDIFTGRGISGAVHTRSDADGIDQTLKAMREFDRGLIFTNLVDFDTLYGHRNDVPGYARNLELLDERMPELFAGLREDDIWSSRPITVAIPPTSPPTTRASTFRSSPSAGSCRRAGARGPGDLRRPGRDAGRELRRGPACRRPLLPRSTPGSRAST
jgi:phosphopentomutase